MAAPPQATPSHNLLTVPPEVTERIAQHLDPHCLSALRLVSRETAARIFRTYGKAHFAVSVFTLCSPKSLDALVAVARSELAPFMKTITLCADNLVDPETEPHYGAMRRYADGEGPLWVHAQRRGYEAECQAYKAQQTLASTNQDLRILTTSLCGLRRKGIRPSIEVMTYEFMDRSPLHLQGRTAGPVANTYEMCVARYCDITLDAIASSGIELEGFAVMCEWAGMPISKFVRQPATLDNMVTVFSRLRRLELYFTSRQHDQEATARLSQCLANAPNLQHLDLTSHNEHLTQLDQDLLRLMFPALMQWHLSGWTVHYSDALNYMRKHGNLHRASFIRCCFVFDTERSTIEAPDSDCLFQRFRSDGLLYEIITWDCEIQLT